MIIYNSDDKKAAIDAAALQIADTIVIDAWLFVSGGSSFDVFKAVDKLLTDDQKEMTRILLVDERYGPEGHADSNWNLFSDIDLSGYGGVYPVLDGNASIEEAEAEYEEILQLAFESDAQTIAILGIGSDRHIAGIKPMSESKYAKTFVDKYFVSYYGDDFARITMTPAAIRQLDLRIAFVAGEDKQEAINGLQEIMPMHESPVHILQNLETTYIYNVQ